MELTCRRAAAALLLAGAGACVRDSGAAVLGGRDDRVVAVRATGRGEIAFVVAARMTEGARHVVVLDAAPPYVKVFGHDGRLQAAFVGKGEGPGELRAPAALATSGDSAILVVDAKGGLSVYDMAGRLKQHTRPLGVVPLAAAEGCDGGWMLYGPFVGAGTPTWLHDVRIADGGASVRSSLPDPFPAQGVGIGLAYGLVGDGRSLVLRHDAGNAVYARRCGAAAPNLVFRTPARAPAREIRQGEGKQVTRTGPGTRALAGMAEVAGGVVLADVFTGGGGTELVLHGRGGATSSRRIAGAWFLRDSGPGGVLVSTVDPEPRLYVLRPAAFEKLFARR
ncbi:MAG TPA: hypothetical protein VM890_05630 [Longimicrobium sp.]|nr:hypothetical protein [Longimicrobium sp.]